MTTPCAPLPISLGNLQAEFGGVYPIHMSEYYRGAGYVQNISSLASIPSTGVNSVGNYRCKQKLQAESYTLFTTYVTVDVVVMIGFNLTHSGVYQSGAWWDNGAGITATYEYGPYHSSAYLSQFSQVNVSFTTTNRYTDAYQTQFYDYSGVGNGGYPALSNGWAGQIYLGDDASKGASGWSLTVNVNLIP